MRTENRCEAGLRRDERPLQGSWEYSPLSLVTRRGAVVNRREEELSWASRRDFVMVMMVRQQPAEAVKSPLPRISKSRLDLALAEMIYCN